MKEPIRSFIQHCWDTIWAALAKITTKRLDASSKEKSCFNKGETDHSLMIWGYEGR